MSEPLRVLSLFAGIGGFDLGLERTGGFKTVAFCEIDKKAQLVLAHHWPGVPIYDDVSALTGERLAADGITADCIVGGFPCQDISTAGLGAGIAEGTRSGLWSEYARLIGEVRPRFIIVENVSALLSRGLGRVLGDLAALGYDAWWDCIPASALGAPHQRDRIWLVAFDTDRLNDGSIRQVSGRSDPISGGVRKVANATRERCGEARGLRCPQQTERVARSGEALADASSAGLSIARPQSDGPDREQGRGMSAASCWWAVEPNVGRVANGVPRRVDRLKQLGNAVVPQIPELIGRAILASIEAERLAA